MIAVNKYLVRSRLFQSLHMIFRLVLIFWLIGIVGSSEYLLGQTLSTQQHFSIRGRIIGRDTGTIILWYDDAGNTFIPDTFHLKKGRFAFSGTINRACEGMLWTDLKNRNFDDPSVIRFIIEPTNMSIVFTPKSGLPAVIRGSASQAEKEKWDKKKTVLNDIGHDALAKMGSMQKHPPIDSADFKYQGQRMDSALQVIKDLDVGYIRQHPGSYLSALLLFYHKTHLSVDSMAMLYSLLNTDVKKSTIGYYDLARIYPIVNDSNFRKANPLVDAEFDRKLSALRSVYELEPEDTTQTKVPLRFLKGKFTVMEFWASWCTPCVQNIPDWNRMVEKYSSDRVAFVSVSMDSDLNNWKAGIRKHQPKGVQFRDPDGFTSLIANFCKVIYVPTFVMVGPDGHIIHYNTLQPSESGFEELLNQTISE